MRAKQGLYLIAASSMFCGAFSAVAAQAAADTNAPKGEGFGLEEVVVTAQRKSENLQVVPVAVTALSGEDIRRKNISDPQDLNLSVPGLTVTQSYLAKGSSAYIIRGQGQTLGGGDPAVATYFDDVPTPAAGPGYLFDLASVETLKGPQGTLFGRNSTGGAVLMVPQKPTGDFGGYADVSVGNYNARRLQAALNVPLGDVVSIRLAADANSRDGYTRHALISGKEYDDVNYQAARLGVMFTPGDRFENYFMVNFSTLNEEPPGNQSLEINPNGFLVSLFPQALDALDAQRAYGPRRINAYLPPDGDYIQSRNYALDNTTTIKLTDDVTLKNIFGYRKFLYRQSYGSFGTPFPIYELIGSKPQWSAGEGLPVPSSKTYSDEIQLRGTALGRRLQWTTGLYYESTKPNSIYDHDKENVFGQDIQVTSGLKSGDSKAVFGQASYDLTDELKLTVGARYTADSREQVASQFYPSLVTCVPGEPFSPSAPGLGYCNVSLSGDFHATTWNVSGQYQLNPDTMFYLTSRSGYKSGGFNNVAPTPETELFQPEHVTDIELGQKTEFRFGDVTGRVNAAVFYTRFKDAQERVSVFAETANGLQPFAVIGNVGAGVIEGAEVEATLIPTSHLEISGFYSYLDGHYTENESLGVDYSGVPVPNIAKHKVGTTVRYLLGMPSTLGEGSVAATFAYQSSVHQTLILDLNDPDPRNGELPAYGVLNLRADWNHVMGRPLDLSLFVNNATDRTYLTLMSDSYNTFGSDVGQYGAPRMYGVSARWNFGE